MTERIKQRIQKICQNSKVLKTEKIQSLWGGYGELLRCRMDKGQSIIVKHIQYGSGSQTDLSHQRKLHSYQVEAAWYRGWNQYRSEHCYFPRCLAVEESPEEMLLLLEDLDPVGYPLRKTRVSAKEWNACIHWLAEFHAAFLGKAPGSLWKKGTYWHLETRPEEWSRLKDSRLKEAASEIDRRLNESPYQTLVHGDAKLANFCFSMDGTRAVAVDFQYVGGGCGMKDLAYFAGSCYDDEDCRRRQDQLLDLYFSHLQTALARRAEAEELSFHFPELEQNWRELYAYAWVDFHRFYKGWGYGYWDPDSYSEQLKEQVCSEVLS